MRREVLSLFLTLIILISIGEAVSSVVCEASASKLATGSHNGCAVNAPSTQLAVMILNQNGRIINATTVNHPVSICGNLAQKGAIPICIGNAYVDIQVQNDDGTWTTIVTATTKTGLSNGNFYEQWAPDETGVFNIRAYFDGGNGQYAPSVSNVVTLTVNDSATS